MDTIRRLQEMLAVKTTEAGPLVDWFVNELEETFRLHQVKATPLLLMMAEDVVTHCLLVRAAHQALYAAKDNTKESAALLDDIFKYREKYRKSMGDFSQACAAAGTPIPTGLSELFASIDAKMDGVMAAAVDFRKMKPQTNGSVPPGAPLDGVRPDVQAIAPENPETIPGEGATHLVQEAAFASAEE